MKSMWEKSMAAWRSRLFAFLALATAALPAWSQGAIQNITSSQQAGAEVIRIELSEPLAAVPAGVTVQAPPRIAIDLPGVTSALGKSMVDINQGNLRSVSVAQSGERTRLVPRRRDRVQVALLDPAGQPGRVHVDDQAAPAVHGAR